MNRRAASTATGAMSSPKESLAVIRSAARRLTQSFRADSLASWAAKALIKSMAKDRRKSKISDTPRVLIAPDKFKGTLSSEAAAKAIERGIRRAWPTAKTTRLVLTDGGEGSMELMVRQTGGRRRSARRVRAVLTPW